MTSENNNTASEKTSLSGFRITLTGLEDNQSYYYAAFDPNPPLILQVKTDNAGTSNTDQFTIPTNPLYTYDYDVKTSDGQTINDNTGDLTITFATVGTHTIEISRDFPTIKFNNLDDRLKLLDVLDWGGIEFSTFENSFYGCGRLQISAVNAPLFRSGASMFQAFRNCTDLAPNIDHWDVSNVVNMNSAFRSCSNFNSPLNSWNVSNVTSMASMFFACVKFNQDLNSWNVSKVEQMNQMFSANTIFNGNISSWDVSLVYDMQLMFASARAFNQDISGWNVSLVTNMDRMFRFAVLFDQDISNWQISQVTSMPNFIVGFGLSTVNYDLLLNGWNTQIPLSYTGAMSFGSSVYTIAVSGASRTNLLTQWASITDGGGV